MVRTALGIRNQQRPRLINSVAPLRDIVAVQSAVRLVLSILFHQLALAAHRLLAVLPSMIQVRQVQRDGNGCSSQTCCSSLRQMLVLFLSQAVDAKCNDHSQDDEQVIVGHLHVVGQHFKGTEDCCYQQAPEVFAPKSQHNTGNHRRQIGQCHHLPDMSSGNDDEEVAGERPDDGTQGCEIGTEVEGTQQDIEAKQIHEDIPYVLR